MNLSVAQAIAISPQRNTPKCKTTSEGITQTPNLSDLLHILNQGPLALERQGDLLGKY
jgi:hypothetical protein